MSHHVGHVGHFISGLLKNLPPIATKKDPVIGGILGFCCGGIGLGLYFQTWQDFLFPILIFISLSIIIPGLGAIPAIILTTTWGVFRALGSGGAS